MTCSLALLVAPLGGAAYTAPVPVTHNGQTGVWFERSEAEELLFKAKKIPKYKAAIQTHDELKKALKGQVKSATTALDLTTGALDRSDEYGDHWHNAYLQEIDRNDSLFDQPTFWLTTGIFIGGGVAAAAAWAATR